MNIRIPRAFLITIGAVFSAFHAVLGLYAIAVASDPRPVLLAMCLYAAATALSLLPGARAQLPIWLIAFDLAVVVAMPILVASVVDPQHPGGTGYATWYVAAIGVLMTIAATRGRPGFAWAGIGFLVLHTVVWAGPAAVVSLGVSGSVTWVALAHILARAMAKAAKDARRFAVAEREATDWQAAQEAHVFERQFRLGQTSSTALSMLRTIHATGGELSPEQRSECLNLEGAIRDEIRGRRLLNDSVREEVMEARRRGATVTLLDEGGLDDLSERQLDRVQARLAEALRSTDADKLIARTVPEGSDVAVTLVGLRAADGADDSSDAEDTDDEDEVVLWLEIRRTPW